MASQSPLALVENLARQALTRFPPPPWAVEEVQRRVVLLLNHVLMQEPAAMERLARQQGRIVLLEWQSWSLCLQLTPAGLLDLAPAGQPPQLVLTLAQDSAAEIAQALLRGDKPAVRIEGDVQLAAEVNWVVDHVRWDLEEDLARLIGDVPAHALGQAATGMLEALRRFASAPRGAGPAGGAAP